MVDYEQLGVFYLGKKYDLDKQKCREDELILYQSRDLVTHAVCVGMTGSGKTGLCIDLLEEAAIDKIPVIAIDPKGDLSNLLLTFDKLDAKSFLPWVDHDEARRTETSPEELAQREASKWQNGLKEWQQDASRVKLLKDSAEFVVYTPASNTGIPLSVLKSFNCPDDEILEERELLREQITSTATSILALLGINADLLKSKEHILLSAILDNCWKQHENLDLHSLIEKIQNPPVKQLGALPMETFFPKKERYALAMSVNNLLASPGFEAWLEGEPLDIDKLLFTESGKNKVSIISISHLPDGERMFFVSLLLTQILSWMRRQSGTSSLRAILYMDEIMGFFPPVSNPPSKAPLLTLLKQARAFGLGLVLATQNPVDLDYKALGNTGTWFIGRLQTERDKMRVLDGLEGAASDSGSSFNRASMDKLISGLSRQVFLMNNVHQAEPLIFKTRWSLSYLRGPLSRAQLKSLKPSVTHSVKPAVEETHEGILNQGTEQANANVQSNASVQPNSNVQPNANAQPNSKGEQQSPLRSRRSWSGGTTGITGSTNAASTHDDVAQSSAKSSTSESTHSAAANSSTANSSTTHSSTNSSNNSNSTNNSSSAANPVNTPNNNNSITYNSTLKEHTSSPVILGPDLVQRYISIGRPIPDGAKLVYKPMIFSSAQIRFTDSKTSIDYSQIINMLTLIKSEIYPVKWEKAFATKFGAEALKEKPDGQIEFSALPPEAADPDNYKQWMKDFSVWLLSNQKLEIFKCPISGEYSRPYESERDFRIRLQQVAREKRDKLLSDLSQKYSEKLSSLEEKLSRAQNLLQNEISDAHSLEMESAINVGASIFEAMVGRKVLSQTNIRRASTAARKVSKAGRQQQEVEQAQETVDMLQSKISQMQAEFAVEMSALKAKLNPASQNLETMSLGLKKTNINQKLFCLCWAPCIRQPDGKITAAW